MNARAPLAADCCPLCESGQTAEFHQDRRRDYLRCNQCHLVFVPNRQLPTPEEERRQYDLHQNGPEDIGYRQFLTRAIQPVLDAVPFTGTGLDFGCGPGPTLSVMLQEKGYSVSDYDPIYRPNNTLLAQSYDFITCTEVIEHVHHPNLVWPTLLSLLKKNGLLVIMTKRLSTEAAFANWHYKNDPTHVCFYSTATFEWLACQYQLQLNIHSPDVVSFQSCE